MPTKILVIHGPNLALLGEREVAVYGNFTLEEINQRLNEAAKKEGAELEIVQLDGEGEIVEKIGKARKNFQAIIINKIYGTLDDLEKFETRINRVTNDEVIRVARKYLQPELSRTVIFQPH